MQLKPVVLARYDCFGSVTRCLHGCIHVQLGVTSLTLTEEQYLRFAAIGDTSCTGTGRWR